MIALAWLVLSWTLCVLDWLTRALALAWAARKLWPAHRS